MHKLKKLFNETLENVGVFINYMKENDYFDHPMDNINKVDCGFLIRELNGIKYDLKRRDENYKEIKRDKPLLIKKDDEEIKNRFKYIYQKMTEIKNRVEYEKSIKIENSIK